MDAVEQSWVPASIMFQPAMPPSVWMILGPVLALAALALLMPLLIHPG